MTRPILHLTFFLMLSLWSINLYGQRPGGGQRPPLPPGKGAIAGKLIDASTEEAIGFANILVYPKGDSILLTGVTSKENGMFFVRPLDFGSYRIIINYIGYDDLELTDITISEENKVARLGPVRLFTAANQLAEVEVTAEREAIEFGLDKKVFNVEKNLGNVGGDALEVLKNIPSITLDTEGNVSLRGSQNVRILVNGKPSGLSGLDRRAILEQIPASTILRVEVLTNPSAKYDPEGTAGIINIVTKNQNKKGFNLTSQINIGTRNKYNAAIGVNQRVGKFNVFASYNYRYDDRFRAGARTRTNFFFDDPFILNQDFLGSRIRQNHNLRAGLDYYLSPMTTLNASGTFSWRASQEESTVQFRYLSDPATLYQTSERTEQEDNNSQPFEYDLGLRHLFDREGQEINVTLRYAESPGNSLSDFTELFFDLDGNTLADTIQRSSSERFNRTIIQQTDYVLPLDGYLLEAGGLFSWKTLSDDFIVENFDPGTQDYQVNADISNDFIYREDIYAVYLQGTKETEKWALQAGLRAEQAFTNFELISSGDNFINNYFLLFPSASITRNLSNNRQIQLSYSRRVNRPRTRSLNPFPSLADPRNIRVGNPRLLPETINSLELGIQKSWDKVTLTSAVFFKDTRQIMQRYTTSFAEAETELNEDLYNYLLTFASVVDDSARVLTWANLESGQSIGLEFVGNVRLTPWWTINGNFTAYRRQINGDNVESDLTNNGYMGSGRIMSIFNFKKSWNIQLSGFYRTRGVTAQGMIDPIYSVDAAIRKEFLNRRASVTLRISDIGNTRQFSFLTETSTFDLDQTFKRESQIVYLGFSFALQQEKRKRRGGRGGREGDDEMDF